MNILEQTTNTKPKNLEEAKSLGWSTTKAKAAIKGGCKENETEEVKVGGTSYFKCKPKQEPKPSETPPDSDTSPTPSDVDDTGIDTFAKDQNLKKTDQETRAKMAKVWGTKPDSFYKEDGGVRFYTTKENKVYLGSYGPDDLALVKDRDAGLEEGTNNSEFNLKKLKEMEDDEMIAMLNRVKSIPESEPTTESKSNMKKILKEEYQKRQNDKEIISKRFNILSESKSADSIISEVDYLQKQKFSSVLIKEALFDLINILYKDDPNAIPKLKDSYKNWLTKKLPNEGDLFTRNLEKSIDNIKNEDVPLLFSDCNKIVELIYSSMIENMVDDNFDVVGVPNDIESIIKKEIIDNLKKDEMKMKIKDQLINKICPQYGELIRNTEKTFEDLKGKLLS